MQKLTSDKIEWLSDDVMAVVDAEKHKVLMRYSFTPEKPFDASKYYVVVREAKKTVFDAVNEWKGDSKSFFCAEQSPSQLKEFNQCVEDLARFANRTQPIAAAHDYERYKNKLKKTLAVASDIIDKAIEANKQPKPTVTAKPRVNVEYVKVDKNAKDGAYWECARDWACGKVGMFWRDSLGEKVIQDNDQLLAYYKQGELYRKVDTRTPEPKPNPIYTQEMKDAGVLPSAGMECKFKKTFQEDFYYHKCFIIGTSKNKQWLIFESSDTNLHHQYIGEGDVVEGVFCFKPIDTRTPEQKQIDSVVQDIHSSMFEINEATAKDVACMLQERGHLAELSK